MTDLQTVVPWAAECRHVAPAAGCFGLPRSSELLLRCVRPVPRHGCPSLDRFEDCFSQPAVPIRFRD